MRSIVTGRGGPLSRRLRRVSDSSVRTILAVDVTSAEGGFVSGSRTTAPAVTGVPSWNFCKRSRQLRAAEGDDGQIRVVRKVSARKRQHRRPGELPALDRDVLHVPAGVSQRLDAPAPQLSRDVGGANPFVASAAAAAVHRVAGEELQVTANRSLSNRRRLGACTCLRLLWRSMTRATYYRDRTNQDQSSGVSHGAHPTRWTDPPLDWIHHAFPRLIPLLSAAGDSRRIESRESTYMISVHAGAFSSV